ncbi:MAG TPA: MBL fold metallo-hydrolase [Candidatus Baltobacteraceae bacterium]|nr:MBL fold metallo-hydrolase [Candidatus Baltobacteraceae bacterium]
MAWTDTRWKRHHLLIVVLALAACFTIAGIVEQGRSAARADAQVFFLDVGQGDAALVRARDGRDLLIDGGPDDAVLEGLADAMPWWDRHLETVLVTHLDADHFVGLFAVLRRYRVGEVWWSGVAPTTETARRFAATVERQGIPQRFVKAGDALALGPTEFHVLWPREDARGAVAKPTSSNAKGGGTNDFGVVGMFSCGTERALFTADISAHVEAALIDGPDDLRAAVLKTPHHGSAYSSSEAFLDAVAPDQAVISAGAGNRYGHPAPRVLAAMLERGIRVRRTDREGTIRYACVGGRLIAR